MPKNKTNPSQGLPHHFVSQFLMPQKQLNPIHFNCLLNNKTKHNPVYEIWTLGGVEGLGGVKSKQKRKIRGGMLIGKNYCLKIKVFLPLMTRIMLLKRKARLLWSQRLEHVKDKKYHAVNQKIWILILALPLTWYEMLISHFIPLRPELFTYKMRRVGWKVSKGTFSN